MTPMAKSAAGATPVVRLTTWRHTDAVDGGATTSGGGGGGSIGVDSVASTYSTPAPAELQRRDVGIRP